MSCCGSSRASAGGLRAAGVQWLALLLGEGGQCVGRGREFVGAAVTATAATASCRLCIAGPGELLRAPPTRTVQAGSWSIGPGHVQAGLIPLKREPPAGESDVPFSGSSTWIHTIRSSYSRKKFKNHQERADVKSVNRGLRNFGKNVCKVHRSSWRKLYARKVHCQKKERGSKTISYRNQCRVLVKFRAVKNGIKAKANSVRVRRKAGSSLPGSDAGPPAARHTRSQNAQPLHLHLEVPSSSSSGVSSDPRKVTKWDHQEKRKLRLRSAVLVEERRRQRLGDLERVPDLMPMRLDPPRLSGPPTTSKNKPSAPQAKYSSSKLKLSSFRHFFEKYSRISHSCSPNVEFIKHRNSFYYSSDSDQQLKVSPIAETENLSRSSHSHDADQILQDKVSLFSRGNQYSCFVPTICQRYHPYVQKDWITKRRKILLRKSAANSNCTIASNNTNSLVDTSTNSKSKFLDLPFINVLAYTAFIHDDNGDHDANLINSDKKETSNFENQWQRDTQEEYHQKTLQTKIEKQIKKSLYVNDNSQTETTTCVVLPGGYLFDALKSTRTIASETSVERFFNETDVRDENFSPIKNKRKKTPSRSCCCCKDKESSTDDFRNDKSDYLFKSRRRNKNKRNPHTALLSKPTIRECRESKLSLFKDTNPCFSKSKKAKERNSLGILGKSNPLFFILYLMALPLLCSTNPSAQVSSALAQKSPLSRNEDYTQRNGSFTAHQYTPSNNLRQGQQVVQERQKTHPYNEYTWEVNQINPWLSACDLAGPAPADLQGSCGPPEVPKYCPFSCSPKSPGDSNAAFRDVIERLELISGKIKRRKSRSWSSMKRPMGAIEMEDINERGSNHGGRKSRADTSPGKGTAPEQCLFYLEESHKRDICRDDFGRGSPLSFLTPRENRYWFTSGLRLRHCCEHAVVNALTPGKDGPLEDVLNGGKKCVDALDKLLLVDALAARLHCEFEEVLARYDCGQSYSVIHNCTHCKVSSTFIILIFNLSLHVLRQFFSTFQDTFLILYFYIFCSILQFNIASIVCQLKFIIQNFEKGIEFRFGIIFHYTLFLV